MASGCRAVSESTKKRRGAVVCRAPVLRAAAGPVLVGWVMRVQGKSWVMVGESSVDWSSTTMTSVGWWVWA